MGNSTYTTVFHLAGEQPLPIYIGMRQFDCGLHVIAVSERTRSVGATLQRVAAQEGSRVELLDVPAYDTDQAREVFARAFAGVSGPAAVNLTGGTKPMFAAGYEAARQAGLPMFYIETTGGTLDWLGEQPRKEPLKPAMNRVATFIELAGFGFAAPVLPAPDPALIDACWKHRAALGRWQRGVSRYASYPGVPFKDGPLRIEGIQVCARLGGPDQHYHGALELGGFRCERDGWPDLAGFIAGGWFEHVVYRKIEALKSTGRVVDLAMNVFVELPTHSGAGDTPRLQELDVAFTDGYRLTILECKAGAVEQDHIQKLENLTRLLGGHFGRGILASAFRLDEATRRRVETSTAVGAVCEQAVYGAPEAWLSLAVGAILPTSAGGSRRRAGQR